jgi:hypothetical protein
MVASTSGGDRWLEASVGLARGGLGEAGKLLWSRHGSDRMCLRSITRSTRCGVR